MADEIKVPIVSDYDDKDAKKAIKDAEKIEDLKPEIEITADASDADAKMEAVSADVKALSAEDVKVIVTAKIDAAKADLRALQDQLEALEKPIDIDTQPATGSIKNVGAQADQSRNALANMVGNSAQDLGAIGGAAGSAGTALGQLAEFAADGNLSLAGLAKVAGPMAALGIVTAVVSDHLQDIAKTKAWNKKEVEDYTEALRDGSTVLGHFIDQVEETGKVEFIDDGDVKDAAEAIDDLHLTFDDFINLVRDPAALNSFKAQRDAIEEERDRLLELKTAQQAAFGAANQKLLDDTQERLRDYGDVITAAENKLDNMTEADKAWLRTLRLNKQVTSETRIEQLRLNTAMGDGSKLATTSATAYTEYAKGVQGALDDASAAVHEYDTTVSSADWGKAALEGAAEGMATFTANNFALKDIASQTEEAFDSLGQSLKDNKFNFDLSTEAGRANTEALKGVASALDVQFANAFTNAKGDMDVFKWNATDIANQTLARLKKEFGLTDAQVDILAESLGLLPEDIETRYKMTGDAVALQQLTLLQTAIDNLPEDVETTVTQKILAGDYTGAVATIQAYMDEHPVTQTVKFKVVMPGKGAFASPYNLDGSRNYDNDIATPGMVAPPATSGAAPMTVNVNMAPGARGVDVLKQVSGQARRSGRRYGTPTVHYARKGKT